MFYIFDFDGTLVDSMPFWAGTHIKALTENGIPARRIMPRPSRRWEM